MDQVHTDPAKTVIDIRCIHERLCVGLCVDFDSNFVSNLNIAPIKLRDGFSVKQGLCIGQMLSQNIRRILCRCHDCDRTLVLAKESSRFIFIFRIEPALDINIFCRNSCVTYRRRSITVLMRKYSTCSNRAPSSSGRGLDLCLYERIHC